MEKKTLKTILIIIGAGIGGILLFIAVTIGFVYYKFYDSEAHTFKASTKEEIITRPPNISEKGRFQGSFGVSVGGVSDIRDKVLSEGNGKIIGKISSHNKPVQGLKLRLVLNGSVMSQWSVSNKDGIYTIKVPFGKYRIDGYELDYSSANTALPGQIGHPGNKYSSDTMLIDETKVGRGLDLEFVYPVIKSGPIGEAALSKPIVITWESYPGAKSYRIQMIEKKNAEDYKTHKYLFEGWDLPTIEGTAFDLSEHDIKLKKGYYYTIIITALDEAGWRISETVNKYSTWDFSVID